MKLQCFDVMKEQKTVYYDNSLMFCDQTQTDCICKNSLVKQN